MLAIERRREILARLSVNGKVIVAELAKDFDVTEETIRRDLEKLDKEREKLQKEQEKLQKKYDKKRIEIEEKARRELEKLKKN